MTKLKVGIIGCGTIGSALAKVISREFQDRAWLAFLCEIHPEKAVNLKNRLGCDAPVVSIGRLIRGSDLIIEAASVHISGEIAKQVLRKNKQGFVMSVGGLLEVRDLASLSARSRGKIWIPSGALAGIDGLLAARESGIESVRLITKKPPSSLRDAPYFIKKKFPVLKGQKEYCLFKGSAREAVRGFPQNINVAALLSLAGIGAKKTQVEIWTSRTFRFNQHEVFIQGKFGRVETLARNIPSPENPKTSTLAVDSAIAALRKIFSSVDLGT
jgi:aspartate dehydrogenase